MKGRISFSWEFIVFVLIIEAAACAIAGFFFHAGWRLAS